MDFEKQLNNFRKQSREDYKFIMLCMDDTNKTMKALSEAMTQGFAKLTSDIGRIQSRMARQEGRFELMLDAVQGEMKRKVEPQAFADLVRRVEHLERKTA